MYDYQGRCPTIIPLFVSADCPVPPPPALPFSPTSLVTCKRQDRIIRFDALSWDMRLAGDSPALGSPATPVLSSPSDPLSRQRRAQEAAADAERMGDHLGLRPSRNPSPSLRLSSRR